MKAAAETMEETTSDCKQTEETKSSANEEEDETTLLKPWTGLNDDNNKLDMFSLLEARGWDKIHQLIQTCSSSKETVQRLLLQMNRQLATPLYQALAYEAPERVLLEMVSSCPDAACLKASNGNTALHQAAQKCAYKDVLHALVKANPLALDHVNSVNQTPRNVLSSKADQDTRDLLQKTASQYLQTLHTPQPQQQQPQQQEESSPKTTTTPNVIPPLEQQLANLQSDLLQLRSSTLDTHVHHAQTMTHRISHLTHHIATTHATCTQLEQSMASKNQTISTLKRKQDTTHETTTKRIKHLESQLVNQQETLQTLQNTHKETTTQCTTLQQRLSKKEEELLQLTQSATNAMLQCEQGRKQWSTQIQDMHQSLQGKTATIVELRTAAKKDEQVWKERLAAKDQALTEAKTKYDKLVQEYTFLQKERTKKEEELQDLVHSSTKALAKTNESTLSFRKQMEQLQNTITDQQAKLSTLEAQSQSHATMQDWTTAMEKMQSIVKEKDTLLQKQHLQAQESQTKHAKAQAVLQDKLTKTNQETAQLAQSTQQALLKTQGTMEACSTQIQEFKQLLMKKDETISHQLATSAKKESEFQSNFQKLKTCLDKKDQEIERLTKVSEEKERRYGEMMVAWTEKIQELRVKLLEGESELKYILQKEG